jgi:predicted regulator of Ras-like GTPase activity (Roadblock/LC7/MglB family)
LVNRATSTEKARSVANNRRDSGTGRRRPEISDHVRVTLESLLKEMQKASPDVLSVAVVDEGGALLAFTGEVFVSTKGQKFSLGTILMFIHGMAEAGSKFLGSGQVTSVHVNSEGGKWFVIKLGSGEEAGGLLGIKTTLEANMAAVMLDARREAEKITALLAETRAERRSYFEAPKRLSKLTAEDMAAWWGLRFRGLKWKKGEEKRGDQKGEETFSIRDYWDEALRKVKKKKA